MRLEISKLNKLFDNRVRIGIMSALMVNDTMNFNDLKHLLDVSDGNLASHIKSLEEARYIVINKSFIGKKTNTTYTITPPGAIAFREHINALEKIIKNIP